MFLTEYLLGDLAPVSPFSLVFVTAIVYFLAKNVHGHAVDILELRRSVKRIGDVKGVSKVSFHCQS